MTEQQQWRATDAMVEAAMESARYIASPGQALEIDDEVIRAVLDAGLEAARTPRVHPALRTYCGPREQELEKRLREYQAKQDRKRWFAHLGSGVWAGGAAVVLAVVFFLVVSDTGTLVAMRNAAELEQNWSGAAYWFELLLWTRMSALVLLGSIVVMGVQAWRSFRAARAYAPSRRVTEHA